MSEADPKRRSWFEAAKSHAFSRAEMLIAFVRQLDLVDTVSVLTLFLAVVFAFPHWLSQVVVRIGLFLFLLHPRIIRSPLFWLALCLSSTIVIIQDWHASDNHKYLLLYWLWVVFLSHLFREPAEQRRLLLVNARFFLCFIFLAASAQKLSSRSYRSGEMFEYLMYVDTRFTAFGKLTGIDPSVPEAVQKRMAFFKSPFAQVTNNDLELPGSDRARTVGLVSTWWDLLIQLAMGMLFLFRRSITDNFGHICLLLFIFTTYLLAPVFGFAWILAIMGFTLAKDNFPRIAAVYLLSFVAILVYQLPWRDWVLAA